jgi:hypothetical protein
MITIAHSEDRGHDYMNESRQRENKIIRLPWRGVNYRFYCCVFFLYQLQKIFTIGLLTFFFIARIISHRMNYYNKKKIKCD